MNKYFRRLADIRSDNDLTQEQMADILCIDRSTYNQYETGKRLITLSCLLDFANHFNVSIDYILGRSKDKCIIHTDNPQNVNYPFNEPERVKFRVAAPQENNKK